MSALPIFATMLSQEEIDLTGRRAAGLTGRLQSASAVSVTADSAAAAVTVGASTGSSGSVLEPFKERLELWMAEAADSNPELFAKRLDWDGIVAGDAASFLSDESPVSTKGRAAWLEFLELFSSPNDLSPWTGVVAEVTANSDAPFAAAFRPFLLSALTLFDPEGPSVGPLWDSSIPAFAASGLLTELSRFTAPVLARRFSEYLKLRGALPDSTSSRHLQVFTEYLNHGSGWTNILLEYAALARLMATVCMGWAEENHQFLTRLQADSALLERFFNLSTGTADTAGSSGKMPALKAVKAGISDRHNGAGTVKLLEFTNGRKLVYKRRPLELEADFHQLCRTLKAEGLDCAPPALTVLPRKGYGWVEHAHAEPVQDEAALELWFNKAGSLLCLMHLLGGNDGHMENVIATAEGPVLIDLETLLQPNFGGNAAQNGAGSGSGSGAGTFTEAARRVQDSVLQTGLLPLWQRGRQGALYDIGGLTGEGGYESPVPRQIWENVDSDGICPAWRRGIARGLNNLPVLDGHRHSAAKHLPALCAGFSKTWRALQSHAGSVHAALSQWADAPLRVLLRPTTHYASLLERSLGVDALKRGIDRSLIFEALRRQFVRNHQARPLLWPVVDNESEALENGDIPVFFVRAGSLNLEDAEGRLLVENAFSRSALDASLTKLGSLTETELRRQLDMIATAFIKPGGNSGALDALPAETVAAPVNYDELLRTVPLISDEGLVKAATMLGSQILNSAIRGRDGFVTWLAPAFLHPDQKEQRGVSYYLYDGAAGMSLFLAALAKVTGSEAAQKTALAALEPVRAILDSPQAAAMINREGIGGCSGLGSLVYALTGVSRLLDAPELLERAVRVSQLIDDTRIGRDQSLDIVSGSAGAILSLLALHRATGDASVLDRAIACGHHLLANAEKVGDDGLAWKSWPDRIMLAGYSHGAAGCAAALCALFKATGDRQFGDAARAALRYERGLFDSRAENWPILLPGGGSRFASTWCHGAPGILLSRAGFCGVFGREEDLILQAEMETARRTTLAAGLSAIDHLCCGTMGRVEILHTTAAALPENLTGADRSLTLAKLGATLTIRRAQQRKAFSLQADPVRNAVFQPGFFRGSSGIGHTLLRLARPDLVASVLNWDI